MSKYSETTEGNLRRSLPELRTVVDHGCAQKHAGKRGPGFRAEKWGGRYWIGFEDADAKVKKNGSRVADRAAQLEIVNHPVYGECLQAEFIREKKGRSFGEIHRFRDGSTEWEIEWDTIDQIPQYVDFLIDIPEGCTWSKQPELTQEEIDEGCEREENVVNSYAVYAPVSGRYLRRDGSENVNYETGKLCHVYRPWLRDSLGNHAWLDQTAPLGSPPRLRVAIPPEIVADMVPPITCGPNFGYETIGASTYTINTGRVIASGNYSPTSDGSAVTVAIYVWHSASTNGKWTLGAYLDAAGEPGVLLADTVELFVPKAPVAYWNWEVAPLDAATPVSATSAYWLACCGAQGGSYFKYDSVTAASRYKSGTYVSGTLPNPFPAAPYVGVHKLSCYATYTEPAAGVPWLGAVRPARILGGGLA